MAQNKEGGGFFRRVAKFVANPVTQWGDTADEPPEAPQAVEAQRESDAARSELKEMIERKRRNDFVRKRELDLLRKLRREGLSTDQLANVGRSVDAADSDMLVETPIEPDRHVKTKIDAIEQQLREEARFAPPMPPMPPMRARAPAAAARSRSQPLETATVPMALNTRQGAAWIDTGASAGRRAALQPQPQPSPRPSSATMAAAPLRDSATSRPSMPGRWTGFGQPMAVEVSEARQDPELDAAVIAFANADFAACEQALQTLIAATDRRGDQQAIWRVLFDFYRAIGQQSAFDSLAAEFAIRFGLAAPRWRSIPQALAEASQGHTSRSHWAVPKQLDAATLAQLPARSERWPQPWIIDWRGLQRIDPAAHAALASLLDRWSARRIDMRWVGGEHLLEVLAAAAPSGDRNGDRACWDARLSALRMLHLPERFDDAAIDYSVTFGAAEPAWERALCRVRLADPSNAPEPAAGDADVAASTAFVETRLAVDDAAEGDASVAEVELSGELVGDIGAVLQRLNAKVGDAETIVVCCELLVRVDFLASGDLLNWVIARHREGRRLRFVAAQRLVAMFFAAMGIDEYAAVAIDEG